MSRNRRCRQQNIPWETSSETAAEHILLADDDLAAAEGDEDGASPWAPSRWEVFLCSISLALPSAAGPLLGLGPPSDVVWSLGKRKQVSEARRIRDTEREGLYLFNATTQEWVNVTSATNKNKPVTYVSAVDLYLCVFFYRP